MFRCESNFVLFSQGCTSSNKSFMYRNVFLEYLPAERGLAILYTEYYHLSTVKWSSREDGCHYRPLTKLREGNVYHLHM